MDFVTTSCHDTGTILPRRVRDPTSALKMRQCWQGSCEQRIKCWNTDQNNWKYFHLFPSSSKKTGAVTWQKCTILDIYEEHSSWILQTCLHRLYPQGNFAFLDMSSCLTRLLANATNDNLRVKWEVSFSFKTARWCFFWCLQSPLFLWPTTPPIKLWEKKSWTRRESCKSASAWPKSHCWMERELESQPMP